MKRTISFLIVFFLMISISVADTTEFKVGVVLYLSNYDNPQYAQELQNGLELAAKESGVPVKFIFDDDKGSSFLTASSTETLIDINKVDLVFLADEAQMRSAAVIARKKKKPVVSILESSPEIEEMGDYAFGLGTWLPSAGTVPANYAAAGLSAKKAAIIHDSSLWSIKTAEYFKEEFERLGGEIVLEESQNRVESDFSSSISKLNAEEIDVLFAPIGDQLVPFFKQLRQTAFSKPVLSSNRVSREAINAADGALEGIIYSSLDNSLNDDLNNLAVRYVDVIEKQPNNIHLVALAYDAMSLAARAWAQKGEEKLSEALLEVKDYQGMFGPVSLNKNRTFSRPEVMYVVKNGEPVQLGG